MSSLPPRTVAIASTSPRYHFPNFGFLSFTLLAIFANNLLLFQNALAAGPDEWRSRSIYQVITDRFARTDLATDVECHVFANALCGGTWRGMIEKLDYIYDMGFTAVWISPVVKNIPNGTDGAGQPYHGFWSLDVESLNDNMGTKQDLLDLSQALHDRGMYLMVDLVMNNFAYAGPGEDTVFSDFVPFNSAEYFHKFCYITDWSEEENFQQCWLGSDQLCLPDLDTESDYVVNYWNKWANELMANYSIDGLRIDAAKHVRKSYWGQFQKAVNNTYTIGEAIETQYEWACPYMGVDELSGVLNYPMWYGMVGSLTNTSKDMSGLKDVYLEASDYCQDTTLLGTFTENHDQPRFASYTNDTAILKNALVWASLSDGIPVIYYGAEQGFWGNGDPTNREALWKSGYNTSHPLYQTLKAINTARNAVANLTNNEYWSSYWTWKSKVVLTKTSFLAMRKGYDKSIVSIITNQGSGQAKDDGPYEIGDTNFLSGDTLVDVISCDTQVAQEYGVMTVTVKKGEPQVWIPTEYLVNSTLCPDVSRSATAVISSAPRTTTTTTTMLLLSSSPITFAFVLVMGAALLV